MAEPKAERGVPVGADAPTFELPAIDGSTVTLEHFKGKQPVVLIFYRGWW